MALPLSYETVELSRPKRTLYIISTCNLVAVSYEVLACAQMESSFKGGSEAVIYPTGAAKLTNARDYLMPCEADHGCPAATHWYIRYGTTTAHPLIPFHFIPSTIARLPIRQVSCTPKHH